MGQALAHWLQIGEIWARMYISVCIGSFLWYMISLNCFLKRFEGSQISSL